MRFVRSITHGGFGLGNQGHMVIHHPRSAERTSSAGSHRTIQHWQTGSLASRPHETGKLPRLDRHGDDTYMVLDGQGGPGRGGFRRLLASQCSRPSGRRRQARQGGRGGPSACAWSPAAVESVATSSPQFRPSREELAPKPPVIRK